MNTSLHNIFYANINKKELTNRTVIRTTDDNEIVIDVTDLPTEQQQDLVEKYTEYQKYRNKMRDTIPSFESWYELTHHQTIQPNGLS